MNLNEVNDHLYIACAQAVTDENIQKNGITCIINCSMREPKFKLDNIRYLAIMVEDNVRADIFSHIDEVADTIHEVHESGGKTLVYCIAGISRSASFCIAYLMKYQGLSLRAAFRHLRSQRRVVCPNNGFFEQLINFELGLFGQQTVKMVTVPNADSENCLVPDLFLEMFKGIVWIKSMKNSFKQQQQ